MTESEWTRQIDKQLEDLNAVVIRIVGGMMQAPGLPDRCVWHSRWHGWLEFKGERTPLSTIQKKRIDDLNARVAGSTFVCRYSADGSHEIQNSVGDCIGTFTSGKQLIDALVVLTRWAQTHV